MRQTLGTVAAWCARRPRVVVAVWVALAAVGASQVASLEHSLLGGGYVVNGAPSTEVDRVLEAEFRDTVGSIFVAVPEGPRARARTARVPRRVRGIDTIVDSRLIAPGSKRRPGVVTVTTSLSRSDSPRVVDDVRDAVAGLDARVGGEPGFYRDMIDVSLDDVRTAELIAIPLVLLVLLVIFGSVMAAAVALSVGVAGVAAGLLCMSVISDAIDVPVYALNLCVLVGLGAGIDYALLSVTRIREEVAFGAAMPDAVRAAGTHAGHTVCISAGAVVLALGGLALTGLAGFFGLSVTVAATLACVALSALTLIPALAGLSGERLVARRRRVRTRVSLMQPVLQRVTARPWAATALAVGILLLLASPVLHMRLAQPDVRVFPSGTESRETALLVRDALGTGAVSPILVSVDRAVTGRADLRRFARTAERTAGVAEVRPVRGPEHTLLVIRYRGSPVSPGSERAIRHLAAIAPDGLAVGGPGAERIEESDMYDERMPIVLAVILVLTMAIFTLAFRSVVIPLKAAAVNLLSVTATLGVVVWVFQDAHLTSLFGFQTLEGGVATFIPLWIFSVVYGLSMDYEVFLLSRIAEERAAGKPPGAAVVDGTRGTSRVITGAALIMLAVCLPFCFSSLVFTQVAGFALAVGIVLDATLVRLVLVPALMTLLGERAWWWPKVRRGAASTPGPPQTARG